MAKHKQNLPKHNLINTYYLNGKEWNILIRVVIETLNATLCVISNVKRTIYFSSIILRKVYVCPQ